MNISIMMTFENPYGREYIKQLLENAIQIHSVIIERGSKGERLGYKLNNERTRGYYRPPRLVHLLDGHLIPLYFTKRHNGPACEALLKNLTPDLMILGGAGGILTNRILSIPRIGTLNGHPGLLPQFRGSSPVAWAIHYDHPVGATCHFVEETIDTGPIICQEALTVHRGDKYEQIESNVMVLCGKLLVEAIKKIEKGGYEKDLRIQGEGKTYKRQQPELVAEVKRKLASLEYKHYSK